MALRRKRSRQWRKRRAPAEDQATGTPSSAELTDRIYELVAKAEYFYALKRYKQALAVCAELAALDPGHMTAEQMRMACERRLGRRRAIWAAVLVGVLAAGAAGVLVVLSISRISIEPPPGVIHIRERQSRVFRAIARFHGSSELEYTWRLLDENGGGVPTKERRTLAVHPGSPWECTYTPPYNLVRAAEKKRTVSRTIVLSAVGEGGKELVRAQWKVVVENSPSRPTVVSLSPRPEAKIAVLVGKAKRAFTLEAFDSDGGKDLTYEWLVGERAVAKGASPSWTYEPQPNELLGRPDFRADPFAPPQTITCRISNSFGEPMPVEIRWKVYLVAKNSPPQLVSFEPQLPALFSIKEGERRKIIATVYDPDEGEALSLRWELDGDVVSRQDFCILEFRHDTTEDEKVVDLRVVVSDACGAAAEQSWKVRVLDAPPPGPR